MTRRAQDEFAGLPTLTIDDMRAEILSGLADVEAGRTVDGESALRRFRTLAEKLRRETVAVGTAQR